MNRLYVRLCLLVMLAGCAAPTAPNGMSWEEFNAARFRLIVTHQAADVVACEELGQVRGSDYTDIATAKDAAEEKAVILGGDTLLYTKLWTEWSPYLPFARLRELHHADASVYKCSR